MRRTLLYILLFFACCRLLPLSAAEPIDTIRLATMLENNQYDALIQLTTRELKRFPKSGAMYYYRSSAYSAQGQYTEAITDLDRAIRWPKEVPMLPADLYSRRAVLYMMINDTVSALTDLSMAIHCARKYPHNAKYNVQRAQAYAYYERYADAAEDYKAACQLEPDNTGYQLEQARYLAVSGRVSQAQQLLEDLSALHPEQVEAPYLLSVILCYSEEEYEAAVEWNITALTRRYLYDRSIGESDILFLVGAFNYPFVYRALSDEIDRYDLQEHYGLRDLFYLLRSELLRQHSYDADALADLDSVSIFSFDRSLEPAIEQNRIQCLIHLHRWQEVLDRTTHLIPLYPESAVFYLARGIAHYSLCHTSQAEQDILKSYELNPTANTASMLGQLYMEQKRYAEALEKFNYAVLESDSTAEYIRTYYAMRGDAYLQLRDTASAYADFDYVLSCDTTYRNSIRHVVLYRRGYKQEALEWIQQVITQNPVANAFYDAACLYALENDTVRALQYLDIALNWGYQDIEHIERDRDLKGLLTHPEFQALIARYKPAPKTAAKPKSTTKKTTPKKKK